MTDVPLEKELAAESPGLTDTSSRVRFKLPKTARMPAGAAYSRVFQGRRVVSDGLISLHFAPNGSATHRMGLAVAKKMFRKAVARNRIKRLIREAFRMERPRFGGGLDVVVRPKSKELTLEGLRASLRTLVPKAERKFASSMATPAPRSAEGPSPSKDSGR